VKGKNRIAFSDFSNRWWEETKQNDSLVLISDKKHNNRCKGWRTSNRREIGDGRIGEECLGTAESLKNGVGRIGEECLATVKWAKNV
jgi:hypothetical protein